MKLSAADLTLVCLNTSVMNAWFVLSVVKRNDMDGVTIKKGSHSLTHTSHAVECHMLLNSGILLDLVCKFISPTEGKEGI